MARTTLPLIVRGFGSGICAVVVVAQCFGSSAVAAPNPKAADSSNKQLKSATGKGTHVINFPADRKVGVVSIKKGKGGSATTESIPARGRVVVRDDEPVEFQLSYKGMEDLTFLQRIPFGYLPSIDISKLDISDKVIEAVCKTPGLFSLTVDDTDASDASMKVIADNAKTLTHLSAKSTLIGPKAMDQIARIKTLGYLTVSSNGLNNECVGKLAVLPNLITLSLSRTGVSDDVVDQLKLLKKLTNLDLSENDGITDRGIERLSEIKTISSLRMVRTKTSYKCFPFLKKLPLRELALDTSKFSAVDIDKLQKMLPNCTIVSTKVSKIPMELFAPLH